MVLNQDTLEIFIDQIVESFNEDVYYQLKEFIHLNFSDDDYEKAMDYFIANLHGGLVWKNDFGPLGGIG